MSEKVSIYPYDIQKEKRDGSGEKCGVLAIVNSDGLRSQCEEMILAGRSLWHRGQNGFGSTTFTEDGLVQPPPSLGTTPQEVFTDDFRLFFDRPIKAKITIAQTRYGTEGNYAETNLQPMVVHSCGRIFSIAHNGQFVATEEMKKSIPEEIPEGASDTFVFAKLLQYTEGKSADEQVLKVLSKVNGAYSLIIATEDSVYLAKDRYSIRPLVVGKHRNGYIAASETCTLDVFNDKPLREINPGEVVKIDSNGIRTLRYIPSGQIQHDLSWTPTAMCGFEWPYFRRPDSRSSLRPEDNTHPERWISNASFRMECGKILAKEKPVENADLVAGVPDSGVAAGIGFAIGAGLPYIQALLRIHAGEGGESRLFMTDKEMEKIEKKTKGKLAVISDFVKDKILVIVDDSLVRGKTSRYLTRVLLENGAQEVHWRFGFLPVRFTCHSGISMRTKEELPASFLNGDEEAIAKYIGATSVGYISMESFLRPLRGRELIITDSSWDMALANGICMGCCTGNYPVDREGQEYKSTIFERKNHLRTY